jgi:hypothetical protein
VYIQNSFEATHNKEVLVDVFINYDKQIIARRCHCLDAHFCVAVKEFGILDFRLRESQSKIMRKKVMSEGITT